MANPARELHTIYGQWRDRIADSPGATMDAVVQPKTEQGSREVLRVARLLSGIELLIEQLDASGHPVSLYRRQLPDWTLGLIGYTAKWDLAGVGPGHVMSDDHMDEIEGFANFLVGRVPELPVGANVKLRDVLAQARALLEKDDGIDPALREYIHRLLAEIESALDDAAVGSVYDFAAGAQRLWVAFRAAETVSKMPGLWRDLWISMATNLASSGIVAGAAAGLGAIGG